MRVDDILAAWNEGTITDQQALNQITDDFSEVDAVFERAKHAREQHRDAISMIVAKTGKVRASGYDFIITSASTSTSYDPDKVTAVLIQLSAEGHPLASALANAKRETGRAGSLRMTKVKQ